MTNNINEKILISVNDNPKICDICKNQPSFIEECGVSLCNDCLIQQKKAYLDAYSQKPVLHFSYNEITQKIILGNEDCAQSREFLIEHDISNILICAEGCNASFPNDIFEYKTLYLDDAIDENLLPWLYEAFEFIDGSKKKVYVHCVMGISRSSSIVIAYLMYKQKLSFNDAFEFVHSKRQQINPNSGFTEQLIKLDTLLSENNYNIEILKDFKD